METVKPIFQDKPLYPKILWKRPVHSYKAGAGKIFVMAGSKKMSGQAMLSAEAAFRCGTGIITLAIPKGIKPVYKEIIPESMILELPETPSGSIAKKAKEEILENLNTCDIGIIGPGLSTNAETSQLIWEVIFESKTPLVLDADAISAIITGISVIMRNSGISFLKEYFSKKHAEFVIEINLNELNKLNNYIFPDERLKTLTNLEKVMDSLKRIAEALSSTIILTGLQTIMASPEGEIIINRSDLSMDKKVASSEVLAGVIGSFMGQNPSNHKEAIITSVYLADLAEKLALKHVNNRHMIATDVIRELGRAIKVAEEE